MKSTPIWLLAATLAFLHSGLAKADAFDDKARAAANQALQQARSKEYSEKYNLITKYNSEIVRRVPRTAQITGCFDRDASFYRTMENGCHLADSSWNNIPVQICTDGYGNSDNLPPEIVECHYHVTASGQDCVIYRNSSIKPTCY